MSVYDYYLVGLFLNKPRQNPRRFLQMHCRKTENMSATVHIDSVPCFLLNKVNRNFVVRKAIIFKLAHIGCNLNLFSLSLVKVVQYDIVSVRSVGHANESRVKTRAWTSLVLMVLVWIFNID